LKCTKCNLYKTSKSGKYTCVKLDGIGDTLSNILLVGDAPGASEVMERKPFTGKAGQLLHKYLNLIGINSKDIFLTNIIRCRPPMNRPPTDGEVKACAGYLEDEIDVIKPKVIGLLGNTTLKYFLNKTGITQMHGNKIWSDKYNCWLLPLYHPSFVLRFNNNATQHVEFKSDLNKLKILIMEQNTSKKETILKLADTLPKVKKAIDYLLTKDECSFDLETTGLSFLTSKILCASFSPIEGLGIVIPYQDERIFNKEKQLIVQKELQRFFISNIKKIAQNGKFDTNFLVYNGIDVRNFYFDTMLASYILNEEGKFGLGELALIYTNMGGYKDVLQNYIKGRIKIPYKVNVEKEINEEQLDFFKDNIEVKTVTKFKKATILDAPINQLYEYAAKDADATFRVYKSLKPLLEKENLWKLFNKIIMPTSMVLTRMELAGISLDTKYLDYISEKLLIKIKKLEEDIFEAPAIKKYYKKYNVTKINIDSPIQLRKLLFDVLELTSVKETDTGAESTDKYALEILAKTSKNKLLKDILVYRKAQKFYTTYIKAYKLIGEESIDKKIHTTYKLYGTVTGRLSSSNPNLQNIPKRDEAAKIIRKALVSNSHKNILIEADYKQLEFRVFAHFTDDKKLITMASGKDIHTEIAKQIFKKQEISKLERSMAKTAVFGGIMYGGGASIIVSEFGINFGEAERIIMEFYNEFPAAKKYISEQKCFAREKGYVVNLFGRKRRLYDIYSKDQKKLNGAYRQAINARIQSTAADIVYLGMIKLYQNLKEKPCKLLLNIHDAIVFDCVENKLSEILPIIKTSMENCIELKVPLVVDIELGKNLGEMYSENNI